MLLGFVLVVYIIKHLTAMGKKIENYVLQNMVGEGQFGKVYRAVNEKTLQTVAIKIIRIQKFKSSPKLEQFTINQIQTLSKIEDTTHVVRFIQILKTANNYYFVYEYCNGGTLEQEIRKDGKIEERKALHYLRDLLKAFAILSKSNIMHRDIKPSNILLHNGIIKLADFGFCKPLKDAKDLSQTMLGSPIYMAPEILKGEIYTMKADIWSLGVVLYEMLFGFCPFQEKTIAKLIGLIEEGTVVFPSNVSISKKTEELLRKMLVKDQFKRINWEELFNFSFEEKQVEPVPPYATSNPLSNPFSNPFSKKYISVSAEDRYLSTDYPNRPPSAAGTIAQPTKAKGKERELVELCLERRAKIQNGVRLIKQLLSSNSSKLTVFICCFISKRVRGYSREMGEFIKKVQGDKENMRGSRVLGVLSEERLKVDEKMTAFQVDHIQEPQDIVYLRYAEEENLTQEKEGLTQLLRIDDYLNGKCGDYSAVGKKDLLEMYQKRVMMNN